MRELNINTKLLTLQTSNEQKTQREGGVSFLKMYVCSRNNEGDDPGSRRGMIKVELPDFLLLHPSNSSS